MNTVYLLDVNVLIALADPAHVQHEPAHAWFAKEGHGQVTDTYLLALARTHGGRLASLDRRLVVNAVRDGADAWP